MRIVDGSEDRFPVKNTFIHLVAWAEDGGCLRGEDSNTLAVRGRSLTRNKTDPCPHAKQESASLPFVSDCCDAGIVGSSSVSTCAAGSLNAKGASAHACIATFANDLASFDYAMYGGSDPLDAHINNHQMPSTPELTPRWSSSTEAATLPSTPELTPRWSSSKEAATSPSTPELTPRWSSPTEAATSSGCTSDCASVICDEQSFSFTIRKADGVPLGLEISPSDDAQVFIVHKVLMDGAIDAWNRQCDWAPGGGLMVLPGDHVVSVNGQSGCESMVKEMQEKRMLKLVIVRVGGSCDIDTLPSVLAFDTCAWNILKDFPASVSWFPCYGFDQRLTPDCLAMCNAEFGHAPFVGDV